MQGKGCRKRRLQINSTLLTGSCNNFPTDSCSGSPCPGEVLGTPERCWLPGALLHREGFGKLPARAGGWGGPTALELLQVCSSTRST